MIIIHHVNILFDRCTWHFDASVQDNVYDKIVYLLVTRDIDLNIPFTPVYGSTHELILPAPTPGNFIPFDDVTETDIIGWIDDLDPDFLQKQEQNTKEIRIKYRNSGIYPPL